MKIFIICSNYHTKVGMSLVGIEGVAVYKQSSLNDEVQKAINNPGIGILLIEEHLLKNVNIPIRNVPIVVAIPKI